MKSRFARLKPFFVIGVLAVLSIAAFVTRQRWLGFVRHEEPQASQAIASKSTAPIENKKIILSDQAIANLGLQAKPAQPETYWKTIQVPGMVVDRPGFSDRSVISPVTGVVSEMNYFPGDSVRSGDVLFNIRLLSESIHENQSDLFKATQDIALARATQKRLEVAKGSIPEVRVIEVRNQIARLEVAVKALRQELTNRGLAPTQIDGVADGNFVSDVSVVVPSLPGGTTPLPSSSGPQTADAGKAETSPAVFEVQECQAGLGQQVQAGQTLCMLANHQVLSIEGRAFRDETLLLERSVEQGWPIEVDFQENVNSDWPPVDQTFHIRHISNNIDTENRTFGFLIPLVNQAKAVNEDGRSLILWRFRPGQRLRILVRVDKLDDVFVLPKDAVSQDLSDAFVFTQNVNTFERKPVRVLAEDNRYTVVANDGSLVPGVFVVQNAAEQINRMTKSESDSGLPEGYHIHADGSLHKNEDEGK